MKPSRSRFLEVRGLRYHLREWGPPEAPLVVMLHGWMDVSASFQFVVDALTHDWHVVAPDWRGYGLTDRAKADCYWFPDYLADLEFVLDAVSPGEPVALVGHSMGGNVAMIYAGVRPQRVRALVNLEGFGLRDSPPELAPERYARWIDELKHGSRLRDYGSLTEVADRLRQTNPRLSQEKALFLAAHWSQQTHNGRYVIAGDPAHKIVNPVLYRLAEVEACWRRITCPVLWVQADQTDALRWAGDQAELDRRARLVRHVTTARVADAGHMLHHDQPREVARLIEGFLGQHGECGP
ncbi:MAG TPA: alpha/beta hydrolase [Burkholderiaceae bacterium]|jgi:pimeloyl-ACP methyl ester carboxylesterase|nr:alpha/beta hydrolase [Burkholderiaceae bacterium]